ncbi:MAG: hypothetical protein JKX88_03460, partial [Marinicaulis sp.]|nr:hypothetical protein [Marinicaulis sp.]
MSHKPTFKKLSLLLLVGLIFTPLSSLYASPDSYAEDLVIDAPWRTTRDYLPVLFFTPDFEKNSARKIEALKLFNYDPFSTQQNVIFVDSRIKEADRFECDIEFIGPEGVIRSDLSKTEEVKSFWHYIARVPVSCIGFGEQLGKPGEHYLRGEIDWSYGVNVLNSNVTNKDYQVLRVIVTPDGFAKFSQVDHHFDVHVHTIAEQTSWNGITNPDAAKKAFGGPLAMLMESAYALGMVDIQLNNGNWSDYKNKIITTDHNAFFSGNPYESGAEPGYGPTKDTDGEEEEFRWYRDHLGVLGGEEVTIQGANGKPVEEMDIDVDWSRLGTPDGVTVVNQKHIVGVGSHLLSYGAPHFEGPWHGGQFFIAGGALGIHNNISITHAISHMGSSNGFGYASHPESSFLGWSRDYYDKAIGLHPFNDGSAQSPILQKNQNEFVFKGLQIWNEHDDMKSRDSGNIEDSETHRFDPYTQRDSGQVF